MANIFGLDIGDKSVKAVEGRMQGGVFSITSINELPLPDGIVRNWEVRDPGILLGVIKELLNAANPRAIRSRQVILSVPEQKVFLHVMPAPAVSEEKLSEVVKWELAANISDDIKKTYWDWEVVKFSDESSQVLAASISREITEEYEKVLAQLGIKVVAFDMESKALVRAMGNQLAIKGSSLLIDISAKSTTFSVYSEGLIGFTSGLMVGGDKCTEEISTQEGIEIDKAEVMKRELDLSLAYSDAKMRTSICPMVDSVADETKQTIDFYKGKSTKTNPIAQIVLAGGASLMKGLAGYIEKKVGLPVVRADFKSRLDKRSQEMVGDNDLIYGTVLGLAIRAAGPLPITGELNLISQAIQESAASREVTRLMNLIMWLAMVATVFLIGAYVGLYFFLQINTNRLEEQINLQSNERSSEEIQLEADLTKANTYKDEVIALESKQQSFSKIVTEINQVATDQIEISRLTLSLEGEGRIIGIAASRADLVSFQEKLSKLEGINNVENPLSNFSTTEKNVVEFEITFSFSD